MAGLDVGSSRHPGRGCDSHRVRVNPIACEGIGMCAHLAPEVIALDDWGYPMPVSRDLDGRELRAVRSAAAACPRRALLLS